MATLKSKPQPGCSLCRQPTDAHWINGAYRSPLCLECARDLWLEEFDDAGGEFPEELHDDIIEPDEEE